MKRFIAVFSIFCLLFSLSSTASALGSFWDNPKAIEHASESVVMLTCYDSDGNAIVTGSGFAALDNGVIVTNYHVIDGEYESIQANTEAGLYFDIDEILCYDAASDIAILKTNAKTGLDLLSTGSSSSLKKGARVVAIGSPQGFLNTVSEGIYSGVYVLDNTEYLLFSASISHGSSGGALFNEKGKVIGITSATWEEGQNLNFAVPIEKVEALWKSYQDGTYVEEDTMSYYFTDAAGLLTEKQWKKIEFRLSDISEEYGVGVYIVTLEDFKELGNFDDVFEFSQEFYNFYHLGMGNNNDGILLLLSMAERDYSLVTYGPSAHYAFTDFGLSAVAASFLDDFKDDDWYPGFADYVETCEELLEYAAEGTPIDEDFTGDLDIAA